MSSFRLNLSVFCGTRGVWEVCMVGLEGVFRPVIHVTLWMVCHVRLGSENLGRCYGVT